jgi:hypothetical protein
MNSERPGRIRRLAGIGLLALVAGMLAVPTLASADTVPPTPTPPTPPTSWTQTLTLHQPDARLTVADLKRQAEAAASQRLGPVDAALVVSGDARNVTPSSIDALLTGRDATGLRLLWRSAGSPPGTTLDQLTVGVVPGQPAGNGIGTCNQCKVTVIVVNPPAPAQGGDGIGTCNQCTVIVIVVNP